MELERSCCREKRLMGLCVLFESLVVRLLEPRALTDSLVVR